LQWSKTLVINLVSAPPGITHTILVYVPSAVRILSILSEEIPIASVQTTTRGQTVNGYILQAGAYTITGVLQSTIAEIANRFGQGNPMIFNIDGRTSRTVPYP